MQSIHSTHARLFEGRIPSLEVNFSGSGLARFQLCESVVSIDARPNLFWYSSASFPS